MAKIRASSLLLISAGVQLAYGQYCPPLGPVLPAAQSLSTNPAVLDVAATITAVAQNLTASFNETAVSITIGSVPEQAKLLEFHHTPSVFNTSGTAKVDGDTVYRIGSISKVFTVLGLLQLESKLRLSDPITKYVPRLNKLKKQQSTRNDITTVDWDKVTLEALASQLAGISAGLGDNDIANAPGDFASLGLPPLNSSEQGTQCGNIPDQRPCTWTDFYNNFGKKRPVYSPFTTPVYSNPAYSILGEVIENVSNKSFAEYLQKEIFEASKLTHTYVSTPANTSLGFISAETNWWSTDYGFEAPTGGLFSSPNDLLTMGRSILSSSLLTPLRTNAWIKPKSFTSSSGIFVGAPWEIARGTNLTTDGRVIDFYSKSGSLGDYYSLLVLVPDLQIVMTFNIAGPDASFSTLFGVFSQISEAIIPAVDSATKSEANTTYSGIYTDVQTNSTVTISTDSGPGLLLSDFVIRGANITTGFAGFYGVDPTEISIRLYPTDLVSGNSRSWRAVFNTASLATTEEQDTMLFFPMGSCQSWSLIDLESYGLRGLDDFVFTVTDNKISLDARGWRLILNKE